MLDFLEVPVVGAYHLVSSIASAIEPVTGQFAVPVAVVLFTAAVRLLILPLSRAAVRGERARAAMMPRLAELQKRYAGNPERLKREVANLQAESGSLFVGCLPMLAQLPFFWVMYRLFSTATVAGHPNVLLAGTLFGAPIGQYWPILTAGPVFVGLAVLLGVVAWFASRRLASQGTTGWVRLLPYGTIATAAFVPLAAGLYLLTTTTWTVVERAVLYR